VEGLIAHVAGQRDALQALPVARSYCLKPEKRCFRAGQIYLCYGIFRARFAF
jgi:hypothetical protein